MSKIKLLANRVILVSIFCCFDFDVKLVTIKYIGNSVAKVLKPIYPRKRVATEEQTRELSWFLQKSHQLGLTLCWIWICRES